MDSKLIVYGAYGYSAKLIIENLTKKGIKPLLAGRDEYKLRRVANQFDCDYDVFDLENEKIITKKLSDFHTLLNCAGPFRFTAEKLMRACIESRTNYLDITGEIEVLQKSWQFDTEAKDAGVTILPAVGFDVIPSDCLAKRLSEKMPDSISLHLGFQTNSSRVSRGTHLTTIEMLDESGKVRRNGKIINVPIGEETYELETARLKFYGIAIPWGDVSSAFYSTGIPNITVYIGVPHSAYISRRLVPLAKGILSIPVVKSLIKKYVRKNYDGPTEYQRQMSNIIMWGKVTNEKGEEYFESYRFIDGYELTGRGGAEAVMRVLNNEVSTGTKTPSLAFGSDFMDQFIIEKIN